MGAQNNSGDNSIRALYRLIESSGYFDIGWYLTKYPDVALLNIDPIEHYIRVGAKIMRDPGPKFSTRQYLERHPNLSRTNTNPLVDFLTRLSANANVAEDPAPVVPEPAIDLGGKNIRSDIDLVIGSALFDKAWYLKTYPDVAASAMDPVEHYVRFGGLENRDPSVHFVSRHYIDSYEDVRQANINPLVHYLKYGRKEGRQIVARERQQLWWAALKPRRSGIQDFNGLIGRLSAVREPVAIIVPIYNAPDMVDRCIQALLRHRLDESRIILINDASPDPTVADVLARYRECPGLEFYENVTNRGFTSTVNRGLGLAGRSDVVLLNSDTEVTPGWLRQLRVAAYAHEKVGTVTALSNSAGAFSVPVMSVSNPPPAWLRLDDYGRAISQSSKRTYFHGPTGNGFCMYIRRECLDDVGRLDDQAFPRGYGEENDFCMRAQRLGWRNVIDDATLVFHAESASFGAAKRDLIKVGLQALNEKYPEYRGLVTEFVHDNQFALIRDRVGEVMKAVGPTSSSVRPRVLLVTSPRIGGTAHFSNDLMAALSDRVECFILYSDGNLLELLHYADGSKMLVERVRLLSSMPSFQSTSAEYDSVVTSWIVQYGIELVHIQHLAWHSLDIVDAIKTLGVPTVFTIHDYYSICPTVNLVDETLTYCGGKCTATKGDCTYALQKGDGLPPLKHGAVHLWRRQFAHVLSRCDVITTPSDAASRLLAETFPHLAQQHIHVIPHGQDWAESFQFAADLAAGENLRIIAPGNISSSKGAHLLVELSKLPGVEVHLLGKVLFDIQPSSSLIVHGAYDRSEFADKIQQIRPHVGALLSIWPETFCYTLSELWLTGIPVIAFDLGAIGDRIRAHGGGWLAKEITVDAVYAIVTALRANPALLGEKVAEVTRWQKGEFLSHDRHSMGHAYYDIYRSLLIGKGVETSPRPIFAVLAPGTSLTSYRVKIANSSTCVRLMEKTIDALGRPVRYDYCDPSSDPEWLTARFDGVIVQRTALTDEQASALLACAKARGRPVIYETDDDLLELRELAATKTGWDLPELDFAAIERLTRQADVVITSTDLLGGRMAALNPSVQVHPNAISPRLWLAPLPKEAAASLLQVYQRRSQEEFRVVYMGGHTHEDDLNLLREAVASLRGTIPGLRFFIIGVTAKSADWYESIPIPEDKMSYQYFVPWIRPILESMDIGVAPLVASPFTAAKSDLKWLEYSAAGLPCLASNVAPYTLSIQDGVTGLLIDNTPEAWSERMLWAALNPEGRQALASAAHDEIVKNRLMWLMEIALDQAVLGALRRRHSTWAARGHGQ